MDNRKEDLSLLVEKYLNNQLSPDEYRELWRLLNEYPDEIPLNDGLRRLWQEAGTVSPVHTAGEWEQKMKQAREAQWEELPKEGKQKRTVFSFHRYRWAAAVVVFLLLGSTLFFYWSRMDSDSMAQLNSVQQDRLPGGDRAILTLSDGSVIVLDSAANGMLVQQGNVKVIKSQDGQLLYDVAGEAGQPVVYNTLQTPRGGQYNITLPDGSRVWLNAASSLKYPVVFNGKERKVEITGEAYFDIAKDVKRPFRVLVNGMEVEVLGTEFNINGYADEEFTRTTLLEGKVSIQTDGERKELKPGQQARLGRKGGVKIVEDVNLEETVAWKEGYFQFDNSDIESVMRQLARWYDVDVYYQGKVSKHFIGGISRNVKLSQVLSMLQQTGEVSFKIEGQKITVMP